MGGQACVFYGAAEFSRGTDLLVLAESENLTRLQSALDELQALPIAVPPFEPRHLDAGMTEFVKHTARQSPPGRQSP